VVDWRDVLSYNFSVNMSVFGNCKADPGIMEDEDMYDPRKAFESKLNPEKIDLIWEWKRGDTNPATQRVKDIIVASDENGDGVLDYEESKRMCRKLLKRSKISVGVDEDLMHAIFRSLDQDGDLYLDEKEVEIGLKAIWLMTHDGVSIHDMTGVMDDMIHVPHSQTEQKRRPMWQKRKKLSQSKVDRIWQKKRGVASQGPDDAAVQRAIERCRSVTNPVSSQAPHDPSPSLTKTESQRLLKAFCNKAKLESKDLDLAFDYIDRNDNGILDKSDIALAMKAMWLLSSGHDEDEIRLDHLLEEVEENGVPLKRHTLQGHQDVFE